MHHSVILANSNEWAGCDPGIQGLSRTTDAWFLPALYHLSYLLTFWSPGLEIRLPI